MWSKHTEFAVALALLAAQTALLIRRLIKAKSQLQSAKAQTQFEAEERRAERAGRIKAERELRQLQLHLAQLESSSGSTQASAALTPGTDGGDQQQQGNGASKDLALLSVAFPLRPIGLLHSCFSRRNGTPRQPLLVPAARARLVLRHDMSAAFLEGLEQYSHCWVLYIFHENTDLQRLWQPEGHSGVRAKIRVPRLDGGRMGVFATRSPHRPCPIGLSVAQVVAVEGRTLVLGGADIVDGSPILDIKPFVPFCDNVPTAASPSWVMAKAEDEPLHVGALLMPPAAEASLRRCWQQLGPRSLYRSFEQYRELVEQVLSRDIRSVTQRIKVPQRAQHGGPAALCPSGNPAAAARQQQQPQDGTAARRGDRAAAAAAAGADAGGNVQQQEGDEEEGFWKVVLNGIQISYDVEQGSSDVVVGASRLLSGASS